MQFIDKQTCTLCTFYINACMYIFFSELKRQKSVDNDEEDKADSDNSCDGEPMAVDSSSTLGETCKSADRAPESSCAQTSEHSNMADLNDKKTEENKSEEIKSKDNETSGTSVDEGQGLVGPVAGAVGSMRDGPVGCDDENAMFPDHPFFSPLKHDDDLDGESLLLLLV